jgi:hypothetical protein
MTCIATDGKTMATDSRSTIDDLIVTDTAEKIVRSKDGAVLGVSGDRGACTLVRAWWADGADMAVLPALKPSPDGDSPFVGLILRPDGTVEGIDHHFAFMPRTAPTAIGSGGQVALGAMLAGRTPKEAVAIAAGQISSVGGRVHEMRPVAPDA